MQKITQNSTATWAFYEEPTKDYFLLVASLKCSCKSVYFNAVNKSAEGCPPTFEITEVGSGAEDLDTGKIKLSPAGSWTISLYEQDIQFNKDPDSADLLITEELKVIADGCNVYPPSGVICPPFLDVVITDAENPTSPVSKGTGETYDCFPCPPIDKLTCQQLNDNLSQAQRQVIQRVYPIKTGQTVSYRNGDDGFYENGRLVDFLTLNCNNPEGNTNRFTETTPLYVIDYATGLAWYKVVLGADTWNNAIDIAEAFFAFGFDDWYLPNSNELGSLINLGMSSLSYAPFNWGAGDYTNLWTSNTYEGGVTDAYYWSRRGNHRYIAKTTATINYLVCRKHF